MAEPHGPRYLTPAPVREENPHITVITGLEGPLPPRPEPAAGTDTDEAVDGGEDE
ncbi:hypothetical protein [Streptomyces avicenniae]|uniref:hypothetical protein n=1 Tax=Streptomyces avicenniae TaxID=500153 RepID=UPI00167DFFB2|nr:hypothetical protein [Streptomyces avicenniae]